MNFHQKNKNTFNRRKISRFDTPISLIENQNLPIWVQENITCMRNHLNKLSFPQSEELNMKFGSTGLLVSEEKMFENVDDETTDVCLYYKLTSEPLAQIN